MIILISAKQCAGKTTLTDGLLSIYGNPFYIKFAKPLYDIQDLMYKYLGQFGIEYDEKDGAFLQFIGQHGRKKFGEDVWVRIAKQKMEDSLLLNPSSFVINDDCRHTNEVDVFSGSKYPIARIRLECPEEIRKQRGGKNWRPNTTHESEVGLDEYSKDGKFDFYIDTLKRSKTESLDYLTNALNHFISNGFFKDKGDYNSLFKAEK